EPRRHFSIPVFRVPSKEIRPGGDWRWRGEFYYSSVSRKLTVVLAPEERKFTSECSWQSGLRLNLAWSSRKKLNIPFEPNPGSTGHNRCMANEREPEQE